LSASNFYKKGDVVLAPFPYSSDADTEKTRTVVILAPTLSGSGFICAYTTSNPNQREGTIEIKTEDFQSGRRDDYSSSFVRPDIIYTVDKNLIIKKYGTLKEEKINVIIRILINLLKKPPESPPVPPSLQRPQRPQKNF